MDEHFRALVAAEPAVDTLKGLAYATAVVMKDGGISKRRYDRATTALASVMASYNGLACSILPFFLEYRDNMTEPELRAWATRLNAAASGG